MSHLISIIGTIGLALLAAEAIYQVNKISRWIIAKASEQLPDNCQERFREEWLAHLADCTGPISKFTHAFSCYMLARRRRPFDMRYIESLKLEAIAVFGKAVSFYSRYCQFKVAMILTLAAICSKIRLQRYAVGLQHAGWELLRLSISINKVGKAMQALRDIGFLRAASPLGGKVKAAFFYFLIAEICFYLRAMAKRNTAIFSLRHAIGIRVTSSKKVTSCTVEEWAEQREPMQHQLGLLREIISKQDSLSVVTAAAK